MLTGRRDKNPSWPKNDFDDKNNHSIAIRIDFNKSSFLFTGDLERPALDSLVDYYNGTNMLNVDIFQVGHHGSHNATTASLLEMASPNIAVISMGKWNYGKGTSNKFTTWYFGHPRLCAVELLVLSINRKRSKQVKVADQPKRFNSYMVKDAVYGTGWNGTVKVAATSNGRFRVTHN